MEIRRVVVEGSRQFGTSLLIVRTVAVLLFYRYEWRTSLNRYYITRRTSNGSRKSRSVNGCSSIQPDYSKGIPLEVIVCYHTIAPDL